MPTKVLQDTLTFLAGCYLFLSGLEIFADKVRRQHPSEALKATASMLFGIFLIGFWLSFLRVSNSGVGSNANYNSLY